MDTAIKPVPAHENLYRLIRAYIDAIGASATTLTALTSYNKAIQRLQCAPEDFQGLVLELNRVIRNTEPKVIPLLHIIEEFEREFIAAVKNDPVQAKAQAVALLGEKYLQYWSVAQNLSMRCVEHIAPSDFIITHSPTAFIREGFVRAHKKLKGTFKILVLKQEFLRTRELIRTFEQHHIEHVVIPEHNLSHFLNVASKLFIGAVSISSDGKVITGVGSANVVSLCHALHIPVYLFAESLKFAHTPLPEQHIFREQRDEVESDFIFHMTTFSNDIVDLSMIDHVITESGERQI